MHQSVRNCETDARQVLADLAQAAKTASPYSPELDRITGTIERIKLPQWRPSQASLQVHGARHPEKLEEIIASISPKASKWNSLFGRKGKKKSPSVDELSKALLSLARYADDITMSLKAVVREQEALEGLISQMLRIQDRIQVFLEIIRDNVPDQVNASITSAALQKIRDIDNLQAVYEYAKAAHTMVEDSLRTSHQSAHQLRKSISLALSVHRSAKAQPNKLAPSAIQKFEPRRPDANRIQQDDSSDEAEAQLASLTDQVRHTLAHQKNAIQQMEATSKGMNRLSQTN